MTDTADLEKRLREDAASAKHLLTADELDAAFRELEGRTSYNAAACSKLRAYIDALLDIALRDGEALADLTRKLEEARSVLSFIADDAPTHYGSCVTMKQAEIAERWILTAKHARDYVADGTLPQLMRLSRADAVPTAEADAESRK